MSDWKPGNVAMVQCSDGQYRRAGYRRGTIGNPEAWEFEDGAMRRVNESCTRPLVVIDPEDREAVERLHALVVKPGWGEVTPTGMAEALREFAAPKPPRPDEPTGLGAVVEDDGGVRYSRIGRSSGCWLKNDGGMHGYLWHEISAVRVLSEGVTS